MTEKEKRRTNTNNVEVTFHLPRELVKALRMKAVQDEMKFSKAAEIGLAQYLGLSKEEKAKEALASPSKKEKIVKK